MFNSRRILEICRTPGFALLACPLMLFVGCGAPVDSQIGAIEGDPQAAADEVLRLYDADSDGALDAAELDKSPALASALSRMDGNGDGRLTAAELVARFEKYKMLSTHVPGEVVIFSGDSPVADADVTFVPEPFMGPSIPSYQGVTNANGVSTMTSTPKTPGFVVGFYTVRVQQSDGTESVRGCEIIDDSGFGREIRFDVGP
ncbi:MAG: hypothetical protein ACR2NU_01025 [Aeoliella sp.]